MVTKVRIIPGKDETIEQAEEKLYKALNSHRTGEIHTEDFTDPAMKDLVETMTDAHTKAYNELLQEIFEILDKEYSDYT